ncbi:MAG TPA: hypothetical protein VL749_10805 [Patescibacteria group bacterium]|jgi:hypothetical protein|nr:hypothetical protein [Patescibacteria group bacterium]
MFVSSRFVYLELQKTGTTHIRRLLRENLGGTTIGKHNPITPDLLDGSRVVLGSIRDPWEWYVSLWAFGCDHRGDLYRAATHDRRMRGHGWRSDARRAAARLAAEFRRRPEEWRRTYTDADDADAFRRWLTLVLGDRLPYQMYEYGAPSLGRLVGFMSYRYLNVYCGRAGDPGALTRLDSYEAVRAFEREHNAVDLFIRKESLEETLIDALHRSGAALTEAQVEAIRSHRRLNTSSRRRETRDFYDAGSAALVGEADRIIVDRFGYTSPLAPAPAGVPAPGFVELARTQGESPAGAQPA